MQSLLRKMEWMRAIGFQDGNFPDLIISDMVMPGMDGLELLKTIRSSQPYKKIPVIILSTLEDSETKQRCLNEGAIAYKKTFDADHLMQAINQPFVARNT